MKKLKKFLCLALVVCLMVPAVMILTACGEDSSVSVATMAELTQALAGDKETIKLTADIDVDETIVVTRKVVLDLNGKTLSNTNDLWDKSIKNWSLVSVRENGELTIKGNGKLQAKENDCYAVDVQNSGKLTIENGEFVGNMSAVYVKEGVATIKGGKFSIQQLSNITNDESYTLNLLDEATRIEQGITGETKIIVMGGEFNKYNPQASSSENPEANFVAEGYKSVLKEGTTDVYIVVAE